MRTNGLNGPTIIELELIQPLKSLHFVKTSERVLWVKQTCYDTLTGTLEATLEATLAKHWSNPFVHRMHEIWARTRSQIVSGRLKQGTYVWPLSTGVVIAFADCLSGSRRCICGVGKVRMFFGLHFFIK